MANLKPYKEGQTITKKIIKPGWFIEEEKSKARKAQTAKEIEEDLIKVQKQQLIDEEKDRLLKIEQDKIDAKNLKKQEEIKTRKAKQEESYKNYIKKLRNKPSLNYLEQRALLFDDSSWE